MLPNRHQFRRGMIAARVAMSLAIGSLALALGGPASAQLTVLHNFSDAQSYVNGYSPEGRLLINDKTGSLFGVTDEGGDQVCDGYLVSQEEYGGCGGVFELSDNVHGVPKVFQRIHDFLPNNDGAFPFTALTSDTKGNLYGTAPEGGDLTCAGDYGCGVVFEEIAPVDGGKWTQKILHTFTGTKGDGAFPGAALKLDPTSKVLYGTTCDGGPDFSGTVFSLTPKGNTYTYAVIHDFKGGSDGGCPQGQFAIDPSGNLYGTTALGGNNGFGVVFELKQGAKTWTEVVLHDFAGSPTDGNNPTFGLVFDGSGNLFGASRYGGANDDGAVFELSPNGPAWKESLLYSFMDSSDGEEPTGDKLAIDSNGDLFGTTEYGGTNSDGTIFELTNNAGTYTFTPLYSFCALTDCTDGANPNGGVILDNSGNLYGTTEFGGTGDVGVAYMFTPP
jgi:uncharacterized repeat protein (TIGR03803 family)